VPPIATLYDIVMKITCQLLLATYFGKIISNRTLTWVDWSKSGPHPSSFTGINVTVELERLRFGSTCEHNGRTSISFVCKEVHSSCFV